MKLTRRTVLVAADTISRILAPKLNAVLGTQGIVKNRASAPTW